MTRWCLVVEDESPLGEMLCDNLVAQGLGAELVKNGQAAIDRLAQGGIDLVILDVMLPKRSGFDVLREMRDRDDHTPVLIVSARSAEQDRIHGLELLADDYLTKPFNLRELLLRVHALLRRAPPPAPGADAVSIGRCRIDFRSHELTETDTGAVRRLPDSELRLLRLLAARPGEVVSRKEILDHVFGVHSTPNLRTLDNLVLALRRSLETDTRHPRHLHTIRGVGLRLDLEPTDAPSESPPEATPDRRR